jgi:hypothetical protein
MRSMIWLALSLSVTVWVAGCAPLSKSKVGKGGGMILPPRFEGSCSEEKWDPILGTTQACGVCGGDCVGHTPATYLKQVLTCGGGCGEIYWGPWISDPPSGCDPCDDHGNWVGPQDCGPPFLTRFASSATNLFGGREGGELAGKGGSACVGGKCGVAPGKGGKGKGGGEVIFEGEYWQEGAMEGSVGAPTPPPVTSASRNVPLLRDETPRDATTARSGWRLPSIPQIPLRSARGQFRAE